MPTNATLKTMLKPFAERRLAELDAERATLLSAFPELGGVRRRVYARKVKTEATVEAPTKRKRPMSAARRKALSKAMKRRWAAVRAAGRG